MQKFRSILTDILGGLLILLGILLSWLPGPFSIPLILAGLGLLASNHVWAKRWLKYGQDRGTKMIDLIFNSNVWIQRLIDLLSIASVIAGTWTLFIVEGIQKKSAAVSWLLVGIIVGLVNRNRFKKVWLAVKTKAKK